MKVLVTGTDGYIGVLLADSLLRSGYDILGIDTGYYKSGWLYSGASRTAASLNKDIRRIDEDDLEGVDAIVHLAELSNDPTSKLSPHVTYDINHQGSVRLARMAKKAGVQRFVYTSSCSVYGVATADLVDERSPVNPQTDYARCKVLVERDLGAMADDTFSPTFLRNATAYGPSPRMRFDLVINNLAGYAWTINEIKVLSDGTPWRPLVHVRDIGKAIQCALEAPRETIHNKIYNVGDTKCNYQVREIAEIVAETFKGCRLTFGNPSSDNRSYRVSFDRINNDLPGFSCNYTPSDGAQQLHAIFSRISMTDEVFEAPPYTRLKMLERLIETQQIDKDFFWTYHPIESQ